MKHTKAQAAMEFLMTYGWALLVVVAAIGALTYFGALSPNRFLPEKCTMPAGIACLDFVVSPTETILVISNSMGADITVNTLSVANCSNNINTDMDNGDQKTLTLTGCDNGEAGVKIRGDVILGYTKKNTGITKNAVGDIVAQVQ